MMQVHTASATRQPRINSTRVGLADSAGFAEGASFEDMLNNAARLQKEYKALNGSGPGARPDDCPDDELLLEKIRFYIDDFVFKALIDFGHEDESKLHDLLAEIERLGLDPADVAEELYGMGIINAEQRDRLSQGLAI